MRTHLLLLAAASCLAASAAITSSDADACGVYMLSPRVFWLAHNTGPKAFIVEALDTTKVADDAFHTLNPMSYDATATAALPKLARPFSVTLVGPHGTQTVASDEDVLVRGAWATRGRQVRALEIDAPAGNDHELLAVAGKHVGLQLLPIAWPTSERAQITATITADVEYDDAIADYRTTLHDEHGDVVGLMVGKPRAVLAADGEQHLVVDNHGVANAYRL